MNEQMKEQNVYRFRVHDVNEIGAKQERERVSTQGMQEKPK